MTWMQSRFGHAIDLEHPVVEQVDFREIAETLAGINRYAGAAERPVTVAQHTLIGLAAARLGNEPPRMQALFLLHDAHETRLNDQTTPTEQATANVAAEMFGPTRRDEWRQVVAEMKRRHDIVIHQAAGLAMPSLEERWAIKHYDLVALVTERRDFLRPPPKPWDRTIEEKAPLARRQKWMLPAEAADKLYAAFKELLPVFGGKAGRAAA